MVHVLYPHGRGAYHQQARVNQLHGGCVDWTRVTVMCSQTTDMNECCIMDTEGAAAARQNLMIQTLAQTAQGDALADQGPTHQIPQGLANVYRMPQGRFLQGVHEKPRRTELAERSDEDPLQYLPIGAGHSALCFFLAPWRNCNQ